jgi:hypothetical protein
MGKIKRISGVVYVIWGLVMASAYSQTMTVAEEQATAYPVQEEILWEIKAYRIFETLLDVKAIDKNGTMHDIRAIQNSEDASVLDVKAFIDGARLPVKLIIKNNERYYPLKAIDAEGSLIDIKAITKDGKILPVKGVSKTGNVVHLRAITEDMTFYDIIAMSPNTEFNHVKGIKMTDNPVETIINGVSIFAHVKSIK